MHNNVDVYKALKTMLGYFVNTLCHILTLLLLSFKGPGARATLGHLSVWFGDYQIVVRGFNSGYKLPIYCRSYILS